MVVSKINIDRTFEQNILNEIHTYLEYKPYYKPGTVGLVCYAVLLVMRLCEFY